MIRGFVTYDLAISLYQKCEQIKAMHYLRDQLLRASESTVLNIAEGSGRSTRKDQARFYSIAFGSIREVQAALTLLYCQDRQILDLADHVGACLYRLIHWRP